MSQGTSHNIAEAARQLQAQTALWQHAATAAGLATTPPEARVPVPPLTTGDVYVIVPPPPPDQKRECPLPGAPSFAPATPGAERGGGWAPQISAPDVGVASPSPSPLLHVPSPPLALGMRQCPQGSGALSPCAWAWIFFFVVLAVFVVLGIFYFATQSRRHRQ